MYDLIIIGGGPAAISAGIYAARKKLKTLLIAKNWGGQVRLSPLVENYPGFESILGMDLANKFISHLKKNNLEIKEGIEIKEIELEENNKVVRVRGEKENFVGAFEIKLTSNYQSEKEDICIIACGRWWQKRCGQPIS